MDKLVLVLLKLYMNLPATNRRVSRNLNSVIPHLMRNPETKVKRLSTFLLVPDAHPLDSRFHGNDTHGYLMPRPTPSQADGVFKKIKCRAISLDARSYHVAFKSRSSQGRGIDVEEYDEETTKICK